MLKSRWVFVLIGMWLVSLTALAPSAYALRESRPLPTDPRIRVINYHPNDVIKYVGHYEYQSNILFEDGEKIKTISMGNTKGWQVVPSGNRLFLKPVDDNANTNMTVITDRRIYQFELHAREVDPELGMEDAELVFELRFIYPSANANTFMSSGNNSLAGMPDLDNPENLNFNYSVSGDEQIAPTRIFDDGEFTYFQFPPKNTSIPAFFMVDSEGREALVNYRVVGDYIVLERVTSQLTLRDGSDTLCVFNEAMPLRLKKRSN